MSSALSRLGLGPRDRAVILHADDVGMCAATVTAFAELAVGGGVSSGSLMVPCPAFAEAAAFCRAHPEIDAGVHLTLTSEWEGLRWGPLSTVDSASGLVGEDGAFHRDSATAGNADPDAVARELAAQLAAARRAGREPTHLDSHMVSAFDPRLLPRYLELARRERVPPLLFRPGSPGFSLAREVDGLVDEWEAAGLPVVDHVVSLGLRRVEDRWELARAAVESLPPGLTHFIVHPAVDGPELRGIATDWRARVEDYRLLADGRLTRLLRERGVEIIGYREVGGSVAAW